MLIPVLTFKTGDGKILYTKEIAGPAMKKLVLQVERQHQGIRTMELVNVTKGFYDNLPISQLAILEIGS